MKLITHAISSRSFVVPENSPYLSALSDADIQKFRELFERDTGKLLSFPEARDQLSQLVHLAELFTSFLS